MEATKIKVVAKESSSNLRDAIIAIDAGHGGEDPGAIGPRNELEKNIVLSIAKKLAKFDSFFAKNRIEIDVFPQESKSKP